MAEDLVSPKELLGGAEGRERLRPAATVVSSKAPAPREELQVRQRGGHQGLEGCCWEPGLGCPQLGTKEGG